MKRTKELLLQPDTPESVLQAIVRKHGFQQAGRGWRKDFKAMCVYAAPHQTKEDKATLAICALRDYTAQDPGVWWTIPWDELDSIVDKAVETAEFYDQAADGIGPDDYQAYQHLYSEVENELIDRMRRR